MPSTPDLKATLTLPQTAFPMKANLPQFFDRASSRGDGHNLTARVAEAAVDFMQGGGLSGSRSPTQIDYEISGV